MSQRKYYEAYDDRYRQIHGENLEWFHSNPSAIVAETMEAFSLSPGHRLLEIGCGEGRDASVLLGRGFDLLATDVSAEAIRFCQSKYPDFAKHFQVLDCVSGTLNQTFDFIYAVAVIHMLVPDADRDAFYGFVRSHLTPGGIGLICSMGDGCTERQTDIGTAFAIENRVHEPSGKAVQIVGTSCRMVSFPTFGRELARNGLIVVKQGLTSVEPDFPRMMYAVVKAR